MVDFLLVAILLAAVAILAGRRQWAAWSVPVAAAIALALRFLRAPTKPDTPEPPKPLAPPEPQTEYDTTIDDAVPPPPPALRDLVEFADGGRRKEVLDGPAAERAD